MECKPKRSGSGRPTRNLADGRHWTAASSAVRTAGELGPKLGDEYFTTFEQVVVDQSGSMFVDARLGSTAMTTTGDGLFQLVPQRVLLTRTGQDTVLGPQLGLGVQFARYDAIQTTIGGRIIAKAKIVGSSVDNTNDQGVWLVSNAAILPIARSGVDGPLGPRLGQGIAFTANQPNPFQLTTPFLTVTGSGDQIAFVATFGGGNRTPDEAMGIWVGNGDGLAQTRSRKSPAT